MDISNENYQTKTSLILPFDGTWEVANGGRSAEINGHRTADNTGPENQTFAYDFIKKHKGDGEQLADYEAFGLQVIAPSDGIIAQIVDGSFDVPIGETDWVVACGNMVVIDHQNGEWSVLAHFKHNSIQVRVGDQVKQGDILGLCGNSGNTSEPHIHYHLQDALIQHKAQGLPAQFQRIAVDGEIKENYEPIRNQQVSNAK